MKKKIVSLLIIILLFQVSLISLSVVGLKSTNIKLLDEDRITVDDDGDADYTNIQEAIDASEPGGVVFVYHGDYEENIVINKPITLKGIKRSPPSILSGGGYNKYSIKVIDTNNVYISDFIIQNEDYGGISLDNSRNCEIFDNKITRNKGSGITIEFGSSNNIIYNNVIGDVRDDGNGGSGVNIMSSSDNSIRDNKIKNNVHGIQLSSSTGNTIKNNDFDNNRINIDMQSSCSNNNINNNNFISFKDDNARASSNSPNNWDENYWCDYDTTGKDKKDDYHWKDPYDIDRGQQDNKPWINKDGDISTSKAKLSLNSFFTKILLKLFEQLPFLQNLL